jgi:hypothetical protein
MYPHLVDIQKRMYAKLLNGGAFFMTKGDQRDGAFWSMKNKEKYD